MKMPEETIVKTTRRFLKERLQRDHCLFRGHESEWENIYDLLKRTAETGESNSLLLIGPRGCGKTNLISSVLFSLVEHENFCKNTMIVHLNGLLHTDDRLALKSATVQLSLENAVNGKVFGSFAENLAFLLACLKAGDKASKSVIFILEEFDLFCSHHNQTLLYNLFDVSQSAQAPICVVGITCRLDVIELLEKRVKSRFSHRQIFLFSGNNKFDNRLDVIKELLQIPSDADLKQSKLPKIKHKHLINPSLVFLKSAFDAGKYQFPKKYVSVWNKSIDDLLEENSAKNAFEQMYEYDVNEGSLKLFLFHLVSKLNEQHDKLTAEDITRLYAASYENDDKVALLCGLSVLEFGLVIAIKHHSEIYDRDPFNFEMIFIRFSKFAKTSTVMQGVDRAVVLKAFEHLKNLEFIVPVNAMGGKIQKEFQMHKLLLTYSQIKQATQKYQAMPTEVLQWAQSSLL